MSTALFFVAHLFPWWTWLGALVVLVALLATGLWRVPLGLIQIAAKKIPWKKWQTWAVIVVIAAPFAFRAWLATHDHALAVAAEVAVDTAKKERDAYWKKREDDSNAAYRAKVQRLESAMQTAAVNAQLAENALEAAQQQSQSELKSAFDQLRKERATHVTAEAISRCDLTRGVIVQFDAGAARANGGAAGEATPDRAAGAPGTAADDASSGVALDIYSDAIERTQLALGVCRRQVLGWQARDRDVIQPWVKEAVRQLQSCIPQ